MLAALAPHLSPAALEEALGVARAIGNEWHQAQALTALAPHFPDEQQTAVNLEALAAARAIGNEWHQARALAALVPHLPEEQQTAVFLEALAAARAIRDLNALKKVLAAMDPHLARWANREPATAYLGLQIMLRHLATRPRSEFLGGVMALRSYFFAQIKQEKKKTVAADVFRLIWTIGSWWP